MEETPSMEKLFYNISSYIFDTSIVRLSDDMFLNIYIRQRTEYSNYE